MRTADANPCDAYSTSYAWVDPSGTIEPLGPKQSHVEWAWQRAHPGERWREKRDWDEGMKLADDLVRGGWVRVSNSYTLEFSAVNVSKRAWDAAVELLISCAARSRLDPEKQIVWYDDGAGTTKKVPVVKFIHDYGTRKQEDALFERLVGRVASRWLASRS